MKQLCVDILAGRWQGSICIGVISDLIIRIYAHKCELVDGFTEKYKIHMLVWFEQHHTMASALSRKNPQGMAASLEDRADRKIQSNVARSVGSPPMKFRFGNAGKSWSQLGKTLIKAGSRLSPG